MAGKISERMESTLTEAEAAQLSQTVEMFEVITQSQPQDYQSLEILKEAYGKLGRESDLVNTSKRIAQAYVAMGQLSSAILEYETILQRVPNDAEVQAALMEIEGRATNFPVEEMTPIMEPAPVSSPAPSPARLDSGGKRRVIPVGNIEDGRAGMRKIFVDARHVAAADFDQCWITTDPMLAPGDVIEPFIQLLADKAIFPVEKSLRLLVDKCRVGLVPLDKYDVDMDLARTFPAETCRRWCVLPFDRMSKTVLVATANPLNSQAIKELSEATHNRILCYVAPPVEIVKTLRRVFR